MAETTAPTGPAAKRYAELIPRRQAYLDRARRFARLTIPALYPPTGHRDTSELEAPFTSVGSQGVNSLANKLMLTFMPPERSSFRLSPDPETLESAIQAAQDGEIEDLEAFKREIDAGLAQSERVFLRDVESRGDRGSLVEALKLALIGGSVQIHMPKVGPIRAFSLDSFVWKRDANGHLFDIVVHEEVAFAALDDDIKDALRSNNPTRNYKDDDTLSVYTHVSRKKEQWFEYQEVAGLRVPGSEAQYPLEKSPWIGLRMVKVDGEDYGRAFVEEYEGDLYALNELARYLLIGSAAASKVIFTVNPNGQTSVRQLSKAKSGDFISGRPDDVSTIQVNKTLDFQSAERMADKIERRLQLAFLVDFAVQRDAERVTAEEIRLMAQELDSTLGGVFSVLSQEFLQPFIKRRMAQLTREGKLPTLNGVDIIITTGLEALGRSQDSNKLVRFMSVLRQTLGENAMPFINFRSYVEQLATAEGVDVQALLKSEEEVEAEQQAAQQARVAEQVAPNIATQGGQILKQAAQQNADGEQTQEDN